MKFEEASKQELVSLDNTTIKKMISKVTELTVNREIANSVSAGQFTMPFNPIKFVHYNCMGMQVPNNWCHKKA